MSDIESHTLMGSELHEVMANLEYFKKHNQIVDASAAVIGESGRKTKPSCTIC